MGVASLCRSSGRAEQGSPHCSDASKTAVSKRKRPRGIGPGAVAVRVYDYFSSSIAALALSEATVMLPLLQAASASFTREAALLMSARGACVLAVVPVLERGDCTF